MTYQEMQERLTKVETLIQAVQQPRYQNKVQNVQETLTQLNTIKENLENKMKIIAEAEGMITTDDEAQAEKLARKGHNVNLKEGELNVDYDLLVKLILGANNPQKLDIRVEGFRVFTGRTAPELGEFSQFFKNREYGKSASFVQNMFIAAKKQPEITKQEVEKRSNGKIKVEFEYSPALQLIFKTKFDVDESIKEAPDDMYLIKVKRTDKASLNGLQDVIETWYSPVKFAHIVDDDGAGNVIFYIHKKDWDPGMEDDIIGNGVQIVSSTFPTLNEEKIEVDGDTEFTLKLNHLLDKHVKEIIDEMSKEEDVEDGEDTDYAKRRKEQDDYYEDPDYYKENHDPDAEQLEDEEDIPMSRDDDGVPLGEGDKHHDDGDLDLGHQDDEPHMLKKEVYDIAVYAAKLYKQLKKYDAMENEVDFPHWWQRKVTLAREYMSKAQHYLEFEEKEPMIDQLALEGKKYKSDAQRKAIYAAKAEKGELKERTHTAIKKALDIELRKRKERVKDYVRAQGKEKQKIKDELKQMTDKINGLEKEHNNAVSGINRNQKLSDTNETKISKKKFKKLLAEAYYEVLAEAEAPESVETFTRRYPDLEKALIKLHTDDYSDFVKEVRLITPKPTELAVVIKNNQEYTLKWLGKDWEISVRGERHYLGNASEVQEALKDIAILAKEAPMGEPEDEQEETGGDAGFDDLGGGGGADTGGLDDIGGEDEAGGADLSDEPIDFEDEA